MNLIQIHSDSDNLVLAHRDVAGKMLDVLTADSPTVLTEIKWSQRCPLGGACTLPYTPWLDWERFMDHPEPSLASGSQRVQGHRLRRVVSEHVALYALNTERAVLSDRAAIHVVALGD